MANTTGQNNIFIQDVNKDSMTLNVNGEVRTIHNELAELKELLKNQNATNITYENKVYNIEHINEANFGVVTSHKVFNGVLTRELILALKEKKKTQEFLNSLPAGDKDNWEVKSVHLRDAQDILADSFVWVVGWELRRLFVIGEGSEKMETKIEEYINHCFSTYRISLQLINYIFISRLWDEKIKNAGIDTDKESIRKFFDKSWVKLAELRSLFMDLIEIFRQNRLEYPLDDTDMTDINEFLQPDSKFNAACAELEKLEGIDRTKEGYGLGHCHTAELSLATVLSGFRFFTNYQLVTSKNIEYSVVRNSSARYIKDLTPLKKEGIEAQRILKFDDTPAPAAPYSVFFINKNKFINLFPFLLDYNALTHAEGFQLYCYECRNGDNGLRYFSVDSESVETISYLAVKSEGIKIKSEKEKNEVERNIRLDLVAKAFKSCMNTILGTSFSFKVKESDPEDDNVVNL